MKSVRLTIRHNPEGPEDLRYAAQVRRDLWAHSPVEVIPDCPAHQTHRDAEGNAYFEFATDYFAEVEKTLEKYGHKDRVAVTAGGAGVGPPCPNCGQMAGPVFPTVCPHCRVRDIASCPYCQHEVPRQLYASIEGDLFHCPDCGHKVRLRFNDHPLFSNGDGARALIFVEEAETAPA